jgi:FkbM family methyltransferase
MLRKTLLFILKLFATDLRIKHHFTGKKFKLNIYKHKGYLFKGRKREKQTMEAFAVLINEGDVVLEAGGHIGYLSTYFASIVKSSGSVLVFEPGEKNYQYLKENSKPFDNIILEKMGLGKEKGKLTFYVEDLTGQNNTFVKNFKGFELNRAASIESNMEYKDVQVEVVTIDGYIKEHNLLIPNFVKIDVEGFEYEVLEGANDLIIKGNTAFMVEVQENSDRVFELFKVNEFRIFHENGKEIHVINEFKNNEYGMNRFFIPTINSSRENVQNWIKKSER